MPSAGLRSAGPSSPSSPTRRGVRNDRRHQSLHLSSHVSTSPVSARRSARARLPEIPRNPREGFQRKGRSPSFGRFKGVWGEIRNPPRIFLRGSGGVFFQFGKNTSPDAAKHPWHPPGPPVNSLGGASETPHPAECPDGDAPSILPLRAYKKAALSGGFSSLTGADAGG